LASVRFAAPIAADDKDDLASLKAEIDWSISNPTIFILLFFVGMRDSD